MCIIGITGTNGAGKWTVVEYLEKSRWFVHLSVRKFLEGLLTKQWRPIDRDQMHILANDLRWTHGPDYFARALYEEALQQHQPVVIESIRAVGEADMLHQKGNFTLLWVDAPLEIRYKRIIDRWSATDNISLEKFIQQENAEMESADPTHQNLKGCIERCDYVIINEGSIDDLYKKIEDVLDKVWI